MNQTFINLLLSELNNRWHEVTILLDSAEECERTNPALHDATCRAVSVLMVAHLEGFYKDLIRSIINDLKAHKAFSDLTPAIKRSYCRTFIDSKSTPRTSNRIIESLIEKFEELNVIIEHEPFLFSKNQNPKPTVIVSIFENIGIERIFEILETSDYEDVFQEENSSVEERVTTFTRLLDSFSYSFPYVYNNEYFDMRPPAQRTERTLWEDFLDNINRKRHGIAHGSDLSNTQSVEELTLTMNKIKCLELALLHVIIETFGIAVSGDVYRFTSLSESSEFSLRPL